MPILFAGNLYLGCWNPHETLFKRSTADCRPDSAEQDSMEPTYQSPQFHGGRLCLQKPDGRDLSSGQSGGDTWDSSTRPPKRRIWVYLKMGHSSKVAMLQKKHHHSGMSETLEPQRKVVTCWWLAAQSETLVFSEIVLSELGSGSQFVLFIYDHLGGS